MYIQAIFPKGWINVVRLALLCNGLINHSLNLQQLTFFLPTISQNPNLVTSLLYHHLYESFKAGKTRPPILYLQADNCYKKNKNKYTMGFCALLVALGWFDEVYMSFLPTGHTHEDINKLFSHLRILMRR